MNVFSCLLAVMTLPFVCVCVFSKYKTQYWGCSKNIKKLPGHCKYKQNIDFFDFMLQTHCKYKQKLTHPLQNR